MTTYNYNSELIKAMNEKLPNGTNLANTLIDMLYLGKEAVYRRLRGEVPFTLAEAAMISQKMGVSLDKLAGTNVYSNAIFDLNIIRQTDPLETYYSIVDNYVKIFRDLNHDPSSELCTSSNMIPLPRVINSVIFPLPVRLSATKLSKVKKQDHDTHYSEHQNIHVTPSPYPPIR